jgi:carbamoyl-phosphate synthase large subunit
VTPALAAVPSLLATIVLTVAGAATLAAALRWRALHRRSHLRWLAAQLRDPDPRVRIHTVRLAVETGLDRSGGILLRLARRESDPDVLAALLAAVAARQWEPVSSPSSSELRSWATEYAKHDPRTKGRRRSSVRLLITGAGGPAGIAVIRWLHGRGLHVIAVDSDPLAAGLRLANEGHVVPPATHPDYLRELLRVAAETKTNALICTVAEEYDVLDAKRLAEAGVRTMFPSLAAVHRCTDKWAFAKTVAEAALPCPATGLGDGAGVPGPWVVKPRFGRGSRDVHFADTESDLLEAVRRTPDAIVQTRVPGREFTVDALVDASGGVAGMAARWRLETKAGISTKGRTFADPAVEDAVRLVLKAVELVGPANVQGFVSDDGDVVIHEVNPRFSGGLPLSLNAGADLVGEYVRGIFGRPMRPERLIARPGVTMIRYFDEVYSG